MGYTPTPLKLMIDDIPMGYYATKRRRSPSPDGADSLRSFPPGARSSYDNISVCGSVDEPLPDHFKRLRLKAELKAHVSKALQQCAQLQGNHLEGQGAARLGRSLNNTLSKVTEKLDWFPC